VQLAGEREPRKYEPGNRDRTHDNTQHRAHNGLPGICDSVAVPVRIDHRRLFSTRRSCSG